MWTRILQKWQESFLKLQFLLCFSKEEELSMLPSKNKVADEKTPVKRASIWKKDYYFSSIPKKLWHFLFCQDLNRIRSAGTFIIHWPPAFCHLIYECPVSALIPLTLYDVSVSCRFLQFRILHSWPSILYMYNKMILNTW